MKTYKATGLVYGNNWGGGQSAYPSEPLEADTKEELLNEAKNLLKTGGLDSGMGYESLIGAILNITETETRIIDGKTFEATETEIEVIGKLKPKEIRFLDEALYSY